MEGFTVKNANRFLQTGRYQSGLGDSQSIGINSSSSANSSSGSVSFAQTLQDAISQVNSLQKESDKAIQNLATGKTDNIAEVMITSEKADIALKLMMQVRNKIVEAYQEVMKMQV